MNLADELAKRCKPKPPKPPLKAHQATLFNAGTKQSPQRAQLAALDAYLNHVHNMPEPDEMFTPAELAILERFRNST